MQPTSLADTAATIHFRRAESRDAPALAALFDQTYGETSHPLRNPLRVRELIEQPNNFCWLGLHETRIVACIGVTHYAWNDSFELGRAITIPEFRGRGLAEQLIQKCLEWLRQSVQPALIWGTPRVARIFEICCRQVSPPMIATGHDGGANFAQGHRETHLYIFGSAQPLSNTHLRPDGYSSDIAARIEQQIWQPLGWNSEVGRYPADFVTGPWDHTTKHQGRLAYRFDSGCPSRALELVGYEAASPSSPLLLDDLQSLLALSPEAQHLSLSLLADKREMLQQLIEIGFAVTAYLPGWHLSGGYRYDCLRLVRQFNPTPPLSHGMESIVTSLDQELAAWFLTSFRPELPC